jgi:hypothetical protein
MCPEHGPVRRWLGGSGSAHLLGGALGNAPRMSLTCPLRVPVSLTCPLRVPVSLTCPIRVPYESKFVCPSYVPPPVPRMSPCMSHHAFTCPESVGTYEAPPSDSLPRLGRVLSHGRRFYATALTLSAHEAHNAAGSRDGGLLTFYTIPTPWPSGLTTALPPAASATSLSAEPDVRRDQ